MKKIIAYSAILFLSLVHLSCHKVLDIRPENIIQPEPIFSNESGVEAYMASLYANIPLEDFVYPYSITNNVGNTLDHFSGEALNVPGYDAQSGNVGNGVSLLWWGGYTPYQAIRIVNDFLERIPNTAFSDSKKNNWISEAKFIRAYYYFSWVKRYGGVPLITSVLQYNGQQDIASLKVARNSEKEIYDFILKELDEAAALINSVSARGRANKYVVYALKSRAMLYAASIAKYGTVQLNGILGIPSTEATKYWQEAYNAASKIIDDGNYSLYNKKADKVQNFQDLFLDASNPEAIFVRLFKFPEKPHSFDTYNVPWEVRGPSGYTGSTNPTLEMVEEFEYTDGTDGKLKLTDGSGNFIKYNSPKDIFLNKDPRFAATVIYPFSDWRGTEIDVQAGLIHGTQTITTTNYNLLYDPVTKTVGNTGVRIIGANGIGGSLQISSTGFYIRKYMNPKYAASDLGVARLEGQWINFRYAEILLNFAEAAVELGKITEATIAINQIRARAGIKLLVDAEVTRDKVRHERHVELAYEKHRFWDIRRWRIAESLISNTQFSALLPFKVLDDNTYIFKKQKVLLAKTFLTRMYYEMIPAGEIATNPSLVQNPGY